MIEISSRVPASVIGRWGDEVLSLEDLVIPEENEFSVVVIVNKKVYVVQNDLEFWKLVWDSINLDTIPTAYKILSRFIGQ